MKRILTVFCALALVVFMIAPAMAEVQNIKVSGGITIRGFMRDNYATAGGSGGGRILSPGTGFPEIDSRDWYNTITRLNVDTDLTDNVSAQIVLANERDWQNAATNATTIGAYCSNVTIKEMLYSAMTLKAGRMPVQIADGLLLGDGVTGETLLGSDYALACGFDTVHAIFDYDPLTLVTGVVKITDTAQTSIDDIDGYLLDAIYKFDNDMNAVLDTYLLIAHYGSPQLAITGPGGNSSRALDVYALATCLTLEPADNLAAKLGLAYEFGDYQKTATVSRDLKAMAFDIDLDYALDAEYSPTVGLKYVYRSGQDLSQTTGDYKAWLPFFEDQKNGVILDPNTNVSAFALSGSMMPLDRLTVSLDWWWLNLAKKQTALPAQGLTSKKDLGYEIDLSAKYAYTEDVNLGLCLAWFFPGDYYGKTNATPAVAQDETAMQAMLELGVKF
jgi:hypothetical protein